MEPVESSVTRITCSTKLKGDFCKAFAHGANVKRITFRAGWSDLWARIYWFDGVFARTLLDLTIRLGKTARRFIDGNRLAYYGPVGYFFLLTTLLYLAVCLLKH